jgi:hypothetical protein
VAYRINPAASRLKNSRNAWASPAAILTASAAVGVGSPSREWMGRKRLDRDRWFAGAGEVQLVPHCPRWPRIQCQRKHDKSTVSILKWDTLSSATPQFGRISKGQNRAGARPRTGPGAASGSDWEPNSQSLLDQESLRHACQAIERCEPWLNRAAIKPPTKSAHDLPSQGASYGILDWDIPHHPASFPASIAG